MIRSSARLLKPSVVARELGLTRGTALIRIRDGRIPGGRLLYRLDDGREVWRVDRDVYERWRAAAGAGA